MYICTYVRAYIWCMQDVSGADNNSMSTYCVWQYQRSIYGNCTHTGNARNLADNTCFVLSETDTDSAVYLVAAYKGVCSISKCAEIQMHKCRIYTFQYLMSHSTFLLLALGCRNQCQLNSCKTAYVSTYLRTSVFQSTPNFSISFSSTSFPHNNNHLQDVTTLGRVQRSHKKELRTYVIH